MHTRDRAPRPQVELEEPSARWAREFVAAGLRSRVLHRGLVTVAATGAEFRGYLERCRRECQASHLIVTSGARELVGVVEILDIVRAPPATGRLGYYAFVPYAGRGLLREGVALAVTRAFGELALEGLTADVQKANHRSIAVLARLGFRREVGATTRKIGRRWLDHERWALSREEWRAVSRGLSTRVAERQRGRVDGFAQHER